MQHDVAVFPLLTAAGQGVSDPLSKSGMERGGTPFQMSLAVVSVSVVLYWGALLVRGSAPLAAPGWVLGLFVATGVAATALARVLNHIGVQRAGANVSSATIDTRPVWTSLFAVLLIAETVTIQGAIGFLAGVATTETAGLMSLLAYLEFRHRGNIDEFLAAPRAAYGCFLGCDAVRVLSLLAPFGALDRGAVVLVDPLSSPRRFSIMFTFPFLRQVKAISKALLVGALLVVTSVVLTTDPELLTV